MRKYESMVVIKPLEEEAINAVVEKFENLLKNQGATIEKIDRWGKRRLAYEIKDLHDGYYVLYHFECEPNAVAELDRVLKISDDILRHLTIVKE